MLVPTGRPLKQCVGLTLIYKTDQAYSGRPKNGTAHRTALLPLVIAELRRIKPDQLAENSLVFIADPFQGKVRLNGIDFDENFLLELVARHFRRQQWQAFALFLPQFRDLPWTNCDRFTSPSSGTANWPVGCTPTA